MLRRMNTPSPRRISPVNPRSSANTSVPPATRPAAPDTAIGSSQWLSGAIIEGHYQVGSLIGRGGMSEVYYGLDVWANNPVWLRMQRTVRSSTVRSARCARWVAAGIRWV